MTKITNQYKRGFASFDALLSILVVVIIIVQTISIQSTLLRFSSDALEDQILFDKLTVISEYAVQNLVAKKDISIVPGDDENNIIYPNLVTGAELQKFNKNDPTKTNQLAKEVGLNKLSIDLVQKDYRFCITRLVLYEDTNEIKQLFVCGE